MLLDQFWIVCVAALPTIFDDDFDHR
jgi:hypothetical protein